jgi:hypothetical protein
MKNECPSQGPRRRRGGQPGNRNAAKAVTPLSTIRARIRGLSRRLRAATALTGKTMPEN